MARLIIGSPGLPTRSPTVLDMSDQELLDVRDGLEKAFRDGHPGVWLSQLRPGGDLDRGDVWVSPSHGILCLWGDAVEADDVNPFAEPL